MVTETEKQNWFRKHWIISIFLGLIVLGMIGSIFDSEDKSEITGNVINEQTQQPNQTSQTEEQIQEEVKTCVPNWNCGSWTECSKSGTQTRTCTDSNNCGTTLGKPSETQTCTYQYQYQLEDILPLTSSFPTKYTRDGVEEIEADDGNLKAYDTNNGFVEGKRYLFSKYEIGGYSVKDYFDVEIMFYEFEDLQDAINFKVEIEDYMEEHGGYSEIKLDTEGNCFNTKEDFGYSGGNVVSSTCQKGNIIYWTILSITNSFKDSEDYIEEFIDVVENKF
jgi:hypothetical protein